MSRWRQRGVAAGLAAALVLSLAAVSQFLAPGLTYEIKERVLESVSGTRGRTYSIALGVATGSYYRIGVVLNRYLKERAGYELELVATAGVPENIVALLDPERHIQLALTESSSTEGAAAREITGLAAVGRQYFFVVVPNSSSARDVRESRRPVQSRRAGSGARTDVGRTGP